MTEIFFEFVHRKHRFGFYEVPDFINAQTVFVRYVPDELRLSFGGGEDFVKHPCDPFLAIINVRSLSRSMKYDVGFIGKLARGPLLPVNRLAPIPNLEQGEREIPRVPFYVCLSCIGLLTSTHNVFSLFARVTTFTTPLSASTSTTSPSLSTREAIFVPMT